MMVNDRSFLGKVKTFRESLPDELTKPKREDISHLDYSDDILPFDIYRGTRQNIEKIADQINQSFSFGIYDGCAVLMRKLVEMLLILSFKEHKIDSLIRNPDKSYYQLSAIISIAINNLDLDLTRNAKTNLGIFVENGNLSAHNPFFHAVKKDIEIVQIKFRQLIEELFYKSGIKK